MHQIAFIVNTYKRPYELLKKCVEAIQRQMTSNYIILVIDQNDVPLDLEFRNVKLLHKPDKCISVARNHGFKSVEAQWYVFIDDDGELGNTSIEAFTTFLSDASKRADIIGGKIKIFGSDKLYSVRQNIKEGRLSFPLLKAVMGGLIAVKRECLLELQGFDERFGIGSKWASGEESDFTMRAYLANKTIYFLPSFYLGHPAPAEMSEEKVKSYALGKGALLKKHALSSWHYLLVLEYLDVFLLPIIEAVVSLLSFRPVRAKRALLKLLYRIEGHRKYS